MLQGFNREKYRKPSSYKELKNIKKETDIKLDESWDYFIIQNTRGQK